MKMKRNPALVIGMLILCFNHTIKRHNAPGSRRMGRTRKVLDLQIAKKYFVSEEYAYAEVYLDDVQKEDEKADDEMRRPP